LSTYPAGTAGDLVAVAFYVPEAFE
jgi:hypothetical protein